MPYATRQSIINFPERKIISGSEKKKQIDGGKQKPDFQNVNSSTAGSSARKAFHNSVVGGITGREKELKQLTEFIFSHLKCQTSGSIYLSGLPGTGKTACVNYIIEKNELHKNCRIIKINCTAFESSKKVFKRISEDLPLKKDLKTEKELINAIESYLLKKHKMILLILDEIDQLESKSQSVLYKIFEWPSVVNSNLILIGIANAMDLTDRILPRLCTRIQLKPTLVHFPPYSKNEIAEILKNCLFEAGLNKIFAPGAVELIAAKVAGTSGDVRRALDLGKRVIEIAEEKHKLLNDNQPNPQLKSNNSELTPQKTLKRKIKETSELEIMISEITNKPSSPKKCNVKIDGASPQKQFKSSKSALRICLGEITPQKSNLSTTYNSEKIILRRSPRKVKDFSSECDLENFMTKSDLKSSVSKNLTSKSQEEITLRKSPQKLQFDVDSKDVMSVVKNVFGPTKNFNSNDGSSFPLHQKLLICTVLLIIKNGKKKDLNIGKLHQVYKKICAKRGLTAVDKSGFLFLCRQMEMTGALQIGKGPATLAKISLQWDESEITDRLKDLNLLSSILNDTACLT